MEKATCSVDGCQSPVRCKELCYMHYARQQRTGDTGEAKPRYQQAKGQFCSEENCNDPVLSKGLCAIHYDRALRLETRKDTCPNCGEKKDERAQLCRECFADSFVVTDTKTCTDCGKVKPIEQFGIRSTSRGERPRAKCKTCESRDAREHTASLSLEERRQRRIATYLQEKERLANDPELALRKNIQQSCYILKLNFNEVMTAWENHDGHCDICGKLPTEKNRLAIDHDHETGKFRGFLCSHCNTGIGQLGDDTIRMRAAILYIENHRNQMQVYAAALFDDDENDDDISLSFS